jgi:type IV secretory pathway TraG/TraD family ATPase VirD4
MSRTAMSPGSGTFDTNDKLLAGAVISCAAAGAALWLGAACNALLVGSPMPVHKTGVGLVQLVRSPGNPSAAWGEHMPGALWYWIVSGLVAALLAAAIVAAIVTYRRYTRRTESDPRLLPGLADTHESARAAGHKALLGKARVVRPSLTRPEPAEVGYRLGRANGRDVWVSVEDSMIVLGPPRSGKGLHLVIPMILDAPGAVVTTSTRPDNISATLPARTRRGGPVAVFDPQRLAPGVSSALRWSPIRGCEQPQTAMIRARALAAGTATGVDGRDFWQAQTESVLRAFLHAAALDGRPPAELYRWSLSPAAAGEAARLLSASNHAAQGWSEALDNAINSDPRTRDSIWVGVRTALACLADPRVLDAVSPRGDENFDPTTFLRNSGTLYLLGTSSGAGAAANLIGAYLEDVAEAARHLAASSPGARMDPPLALVLDEVANYPLPSLPALMSEGGGSGITTVAVLQSLAQARARWGEHEGNAIWDSAIVKVILGGGSNARDLADLTALIGERDEQTETESRDHNGRRSTSRSVRRVPIMDTGRLRTLPFGTGVLLLRAARPIVLDLAPWTARRDAATLSAALTGTGARIEDDVHAKRDRARWTRWARW